MYNAFSSAETASFKEYGYTLNGIRYPEALHAYSYEGSLYFAGDVNHYRDYSAYITNYIITGVVNHIHVDARDSIIGTYMILIMIITPLNQQQIQKVMPMI